MNKSQRNWQNLSPAKKWIVLLDVARQFDRLWTGKGVGRQQSVYSVGAGFRTFTNSATVRKIREALAESRPSSQQRQIVVGPANQKAKNARIMTDELCLRVIIKGKKKPAPKSQDGDGRGQKQKQSVKGDSWRVPPFVTTYTTIKGKRARLQIPTDVETMVVAVAQSRIDVCDGAGLCDFGSACCFVAKIGEPGRRFLLGCAHVFALGSQLNGRVASSATLRRGGSVIGSLHEATLLTQPGDRRGFDAALAETNGTASIPWLARPRNWMRRSEVPFDVVIHSFNGRGTGQRTGDLQTRQRVRYGTVVREVGPIWKFENASTIEGDSGSAVMNGDRLVGMHIAGDVKNRIAFAHPAWALFDDQPFTVPISLEGA